MVVSFNTLSTRFLAERLECPRKLLPDRALSTQPIHSQGRVEKEAFKALPEFRTLRTPRCKIGEHDDALADVFETEAFSFSRHVFTVSAVSPISRNSACSFSRAWAHGSVSTR